LSDGKVNVVDEVEAVTEEVSHADDSSLVLFSVIRTLAATTEANTAAVASDEE
jgi:hypothetical protein